MSEVVLARRTGSADLSGCVGASSMSTGSRWNKPKCRMMPGRWTWAGYWLVPDQPAVNSVHASNRASQSSGGLPLSSMDLKTA